MLDACFFETPKNVASLLARYAPKKIDDLLEPSVGYGALLEAVIDNAEFIGRATAIDINTDNLDRTKNALNMGGMRNIEYVNENFIYWAESSIQGGARYDCIVMNPPFCSRKESFISADNDIISSGGGSKIAIEVAFLINAIRLLKKNGTLLAIVPASIISSSTTTWLRRYLLDKGTIKLVHELPKFTFPGIESKVYFLVYKHKKSDKPITVLNRSISDSLSMSIGKGQLCNYARLDFGYISSKTKAKQLLTNNELGWASVSSLFFVKRGQVKSPLAKNVALHTTDYRDGFWNKSDRHEQITGVLCTNNDDLAIKRVGRGCVSTLGCVEATNIPVGDCVLILRPKKRNISKRMLFSLRSFFSRLEAQKLLLRGTGASYISAKELGDMIIPTNLSLVYEDNFKEYEKALKMKDFEKMRRIEFITASMAFDAKNEI